MGCGLDVLEGGVEVDSLLLIPLAFDYMNRLFVYVLYSKKLIPRDHSWKRPCPLSSA